MGYSYRELEFALLDSATMQHFARVDPFRVPRKSALQSAISAIDVEAWRSINEVPLQDAKGQRIEPGRQVRIDSTVTETEGANAKSGSKLLTLGQKKGLPTPQHHTMGR